MRLADQPTRLKAWRKRMGLTQAAAAKAIGFHRSTYALMEVGARPITERTAAICRYVEGGGKVGS